MDKKKDLNLDIEFKKYLQIVRPYLGQLLDSDVIYLCNAWIQKLSNCEESEKVLRNKYVFALCYQLARGVLDQPFLNPPPLNDLPPLNEGESSDGSFTEIECLVINSVSANSDVLHKNRSSSPCLSNKSETDIDKNKQTSCSYCNLQSPLKENSQARKCKKSDQSLLIEDNSSNCNECDENYYLRANNLIMKLREIKKQNMYLQNELSFLKDEYKRKCDINDTFEDILKIDNATITHNSYQESNTTLTSLKCKLQEVQHSRNNLIQTVDSLQDKLDNFEEMKKHEIEEIEAKHKLELIKLKSCVRDEVKATYEIKLQALKKEYEDNILDIQRSTKEEIEKLYNNRDQVVTEKDKLIKIKEDEVFQLKRQLEELKNHQVSVLNKFIDFSNENSTGSVKIKSHELEKRLSKMERTKNKCVKAYEAKIASLQREKHLNECSLQLQLIKQKAQVINEVTDENQVELASALDKLENKYKEIVANMQATAVQRRLQDQIALETLIQAVCGAPSGNQYPTPINTNTGPFSEKTTRNQCEERKQVRDKEIRNFCDRNRVENCQAENKSFGDDSVVTGYCLNSEKLQELFEKVHVPQRDVADPSK